MTLLESILIKLTRDTFNGGSCRVGNAVVVVRYCSDIWEWEYQGETYWDVQDLAEAMIKDGSVIPEEAHVYSQQPKSLKRSFQGEDSRSIPV